MSRHRFGTIERIAFDVDVEPDADARGHAFLALWAGGNRLGATDRAEQLDTFLDALERFLGVLPAAPPEFGGRAAAAIAEEVLSVLQDPDPGRPDFRWDRARLYERLQLLPNGCSSFDGELALLLSEPAHDRLIVRRYPDTRVHEVIVGAGEVVSVARSVLRHPWRR